MARETITEKGLRYIREHKVIIRRVDLPDVDAEVRGGETYYVRRRRGGWSCTCPSYKNCSHLVAIRLVCDPTQHLPEGTTAP